MSGVLRVAEDGTEWVDDFDDSGDPPDEWAYWHVEERDATYIETAGVENVAVEFWDFREVDPDDMAGWRAKNLKTGEVFTADQILRDYGHLAA